MTAQCESVEDFLSRGGQVNYLDYADERMQAIKEMEQPTATYYVDRDLVWFGDVPRQQIIKPGTTDFQQGSKFIMPCPRMP